MIIYGQKTNPDVQSWQSLGAHASGVVHDFATRYRTAADGAALHPLQRMGLVKADSHFYNLPPAAAGRGGLGSADYAPAAAFNMTLPPLVPIASGQTNPAFRV